MEVAKGTLFSSPREPGRALPPFLELPLLPSCPGETAAPPALRPGSLARCRADPPSARRLGMLAGRAFRGEPVGPSAASPPGPRPAPRAPAPGGHLAGAADTAGGGDSRRAGAAGPRLALLSRRRTFPAEVPHWGAGGAGRGGDSGVPGRSGRRSSTTWPPPPPPLWPAPRAPLLRR